MSGRRAVDVIFAGAALAVLSPVLLLAALAVRLGSPGPVLFRQPRVGWRGRPFLLLKFRTMRHGSVGPGVTRAADPRITRVGVWLRRWKLDELPQLVNVLRGDLTLIGPRPELPVYLERLGAAGREYVAVQPGLADAATLVYYDEAELLADVPDPERHYVETILPDKAHLSISYARERSFTSDVRLLWALTRRIGGGGRSVDAPSSHAEVSGQVDC